MSTFTASQLTSNAKATHTGVNVVGSALSLSVTGTASSVILLSRVPTGATLVDWILRIHTGGADQTVKLGTSASPSGIMSITTLTQTYSLSVGTTEEINIYGDSNRGYLRAPGGTSGGTGNDFMPVRISLSDDVQPASVWIQATLGVAISASAYFTWTLFYTMDGMRGHTTIR